jgi:hypothetical protein
MDNYARRYEIKPERWVFEPTTNGKSFGSDVIRWVERRWRPPTHFFHFKKGGHVAAMRLHTNASYFLYFDLSAFFHSVTRTKVARSLKYVKFSFRECLDIARQSTVRIPNYDGYRLPYGYVQSTILSTIVLDRSLLGSTLKKLKRDKLNVSIYVDDVLISSNHLFDYANVLHDILEAAQKSNFRIGRSNFTSEHTCALGIEIRGAELWVEQAKMEKFRLRVKADPNSLSSQATIAYVRSVNKQQAAELDAIVRT